MQFNKPPLLFEKNQWKKTEKPGHPYFIQGIHTLFNLLKANPPNLPLKKGGTKTRIFPLF